MLAVLGNNIKAVKTGDLFLFGVHPRGIAFDGSGFEREPANELKKHEDAAQNIAREESKSLETRVLIHSLPPSSLARSVIAEAYQGAVDPGCIKDYPITSTASRSTAIQTDYTILHHTDMKPVSSSTSTNSAGNITYVHYAGFSKVVSAYQVEHTYGSVQNEEAADDYAPPAKTNEYPRILYTAETGNQTAYRAEVNIDYGASSVNYERLAPETMTVPMIKADTLEENAYTSSANDSFVFEARLTELARPIIKEVYHSSSNSNPIPKEPESVKLNYDFQDTFVPKLEESVFARELDTYRDASNENAQDSSYRLPEPIAPDARLEVRNAELPLMPTKSAETSQPRLDESSYTNSQNIALDNQTTQPDIRVQNNLETRNYSQTRTEGYETFEVNAAQDNKAPAISFTEPMQTSYSRVEYFEVVQLRLDSQTNTTEKPEQLAEPDARLNYQLNTQGRTTNTNHSLDVEFFLGLTPQTEYKENSDGKVEVGETSQLYARFDYKIESRNLAASATTTRTEAKDAYQAAEQPSTQLENEVKVESESLVAPRELSQGTETVSDDVSTAVSYDFKGREPRRENYSQLESRIEPLQAEKERKKCMNADARVDALEKILDFEEKTAEYMRNDEEKKLCAVKLEDGADVYSALGGPIDVNAVIDQIKDKLAKSGQDKYTIGLRGADGKDISASMQLDADDVLAVVYHVLVEQKGLMPDLRLQYNIDRKSTVEKGVGVNFNGLLADDGGIEYLIQFVETNEEGEVISRFNPGDSELTIDQMKADPRYKIDLVRVVPANIEKSKYPCGGADRDSYHVRKLDEVNDPAKRYLGDGVYAPELNLIRDGKGRAVRHAYVVGKPFMVEADDIADNSQVTYNGLDGDMKETPVELTSNHLLAIAGRKVFEDNSSEVVYKKESFTLEDGAERSQGISYIYDAKGLKDGYKNEIFKKAKMANIGVYLFEVDPSTGKISDEAGYRADGLQFVPVAGKVYVAVIGEGNRFDANELVVPKELMPTEYAVSR
ncbi:hypothetical protein KY361_00265 [Candidatus Woesearchaeota archaeon]|nr:hypothetical protein [Candidatus Woesearchaeota archaeon]